MPLEMPPERPLARETTDLGLSWDPKAPIGSRPGIEGARGEEGGRSRGEGERSTKPSHKPSHTSHTFGCGAKVATPRRSIACGGTRTHDLIITKDVLSTPYPPAPKRLPDSPLWEGRRDKEHESARRRIKICGRVLPLLGRLSKWADEDPKAMRYLLTDPELRADLLRAIDEVIPEARGEEEGA